MKILPRNASLEATGPASGPPPEQDIPLNIPKRTKVYIEQVSDCASEVHQRRQSDACLGAPGQALPRRVQQPAAYTCGIHSLQPWRFRGWPGWNSTAQSVSSAATPVVTAPGSRAAQWLSRTSTAHTYPMLSAWDSLASQMQLVSEARQPCPGWCPLVLAH